MEAAVSALTLMVVTLTTSLTVLCGLTLAAMAPFMAVVSAFVASGRRFERPAWRRFAVGILSGMRSLLTGWGLSAVGLLSALVLQASVLNQPIPPLHGRDLGLNTVPRVLLASIGWLGCLLVLALVAGLFVHARKPETHGQADATP